MRVELRCWMPGNQDALLGGRADGISLSFKAVFTTLKPNPSLPTSLLAGRLGWEGTSPAPLSLLTEPLASPNSTEAGSDFPFSQGRVPLSLYPHGS